jgi:hypothetical protein
MEATLEFFSARTGLLHDYRAFGARFSIANNNACTNIAILKLTISIMQYNKSYRNRGGFGREMRYLFAWTDTS